MADASVTTTVVSATVTIPKGNMTATKIILPNVLAATTIPDLRGLLVTAMAVITATSGHGLGHPQTGNLCTSKATDGVTTNVIDRGGDVSGPALLSFKTVSSGAGQTQTFLIEASPDNDASHWFPASHALSSTPDTWVVTTFTQATAGTNYLYYIVKPELPYRYLRVTITLTTNMASTIDAFVF